MQLCHVNMLKLYYRSAEPSFDSGPVTIAGGEERMSDGAVVKVSVVNGGDEQENSRVVQKESAEHGGEVKSGEKEEVPLAMALGVDAALLPVEVQPEAGHSAVRERL